MAFDRNTLLATTVIAGLAIFAPTLAMAQSQPAPAEDTQEDEADQVDEVVITGSRIRRNEFTSSQPILVITGEQASLEGLTDTTEILQSSSAANTATQINNFFTGFVTTGGPGVNTVSLRGLGAQRTLVLVNGRRVGPAGVRGTVGPTDLNTIPSSQIERIEVLTDGASSIYGSDAVAGVINIITKQNADGGVAEVTANAPFGGGGEQYRISGSYGKTFDRGYLTVGGDYFERKPLYFGDREFFRCPEDNVYSDPGLNFRRDVLENGEFKCDFVLNQILRTQLAGSAGTVLARNRRDGDFVFDPTAVQGGGFTGCDVNGFRLAAGGFNTPGITAATATPQNTCSITNQATALRRTAYAGYPLYNDRYEGRTAVSPVKRYSLSAFGGFDLTPNIELFAEGLWNRRESEQVSFRQLFPTVSPFHSQNPFGGPFNGTTNTFNAGYFVTPVALVDSFNEQQVDYMRGVVGLRGDLSAFGKSWDWEVSAQYSKSDGTYGGNFFYNDRVEATAGLRAAQGQNLAGASTGLGARPFGAVNGNCDTAILISATTCPTGGVNYFSRNFVVNGQLSAEEAAFLSGFEEGKTEYTQKYIEGVISGELLTLPAGPVGAALGFHVRKESIDDNPGPEQRRGNLWGSTAAGRTVGDDSVREVFGELEIPLVRNAPLFNSLGLNVSGRYSDYDSYGENSTYKVGLNWEISSEYRIRSSYGTSFRAPALFELFLANQTSFLGQANIDPCRNWGTSTNERLRTNCAAEGVPDNYNAPGSSATIITGGGVGILDPETADAFSAGLIWTPKFVDLSIALDYFEIDISGQVAQFGAANILAGCYNSDNYPNEALCTLFTRDRSQTSPRANEILRVNDSYVNISNQFNKGLDLNVRYRKEFSFMDLTATVRVSHILDWTVQTFNTSAPTILNSRIGSPETVGQFTLRADRGDWTLFYGIDYVGETDNQPFFAAANAGGATTFLGETVYVERGTDPYLNHTVSLRRRFDKWTFQAGIQNIFNENPPKVGLSSGSTVIGNTPLASQYDWNGRTGFVTVSRTF